MKPTSEEIIALLRRYNPWWNGRPVPNLPPWRRAAFTELYQWTVAPPAPRAVLLSGPRQVGKSTLLLQVIEKIVSDGVPPTNILYVTFDHPLFKLAGQDEILRLWRELSARQHGLEYIFIDEVQYMRDWQVWIKHQVDFHKDRRIVATGSAMPMVTKGQESGVGRWYTLRLPTLSFYEYLQIKGVSEPRLPKIESLRRLFALTLAERVNLSEAAQPLAAHFNEYLMRGGFPQCALAGSVDMAQKLLREDIVDKALKRDAAALYGVRNILQLEQTFLYICRNDGEVVAVADLARVLEVNRETAANFILLLEHTHLIYRLLPYAGGKEILKPRYKLYLADAAIGPSVFLKGSSIAEDDTRLGHAVETAFFKHVYTRYYQVNVAFSYWRTSSGREVDIIATTGRREIPFEVKYRRANTGAGELKGIVEFCRERAIRRGYVITRDLRDFSTMPIDSADGGALLKVPAALACYWLGQSELLDPTRHPDPGDD